MMRDITLGQYYPAQSKLHALDPRTKLFATMIYVIALFSFRGLVGFGMITLFLFGAVALSKVPLGYILKGLKAIVMLLCITACFNLFLTQGDVVYWSWWKLTLTDKGIETAVLMILRLIYLIMGTSLMTLTTTPNQLTDGLETSLKWMNKLHVPVHAISMMMSIALRFIPILIEETDKIMKAQMARGADFEHGNLFVRAKALVPILVPLFVSAFRRADELAMAMEARCYNGGEGRTKMHPLTYRRNDHITYLICFVFLVAVIAARILCSWPQ